MPQSPNTQWEQVGRPKKLQTYTSVNFDKVAKSTFPFPPSPPSSHLHLLRTEPKTLIPIPILSFPPKKGFPPSSLLPPSIPFIPSASPYPFLSLSHIRSSPSYRIKSYRHYRSCLCSGLVRESSGVWVSVLGRGGGMDMDLGVGGDPYAGGKL